MMKRRLAALLVACLIAPLVGSEADAETLSFELAGPPSGPLSMGDSFDLTVSLGVEFASVDAVSLLITGEQQLGAGSDLNDPTPLVISGQLGVSLIDDGAVAASARPTTLPASALFSNHAVMIDRGTGFPAEPPNLGALTDGEATLRLSSAPLLFIGTTVVDRLPMFTVTGVILVVEGALVPEPGGALAALAGSVMLVVARRR
ncbi:MAG: hypothetical protein AAFV43_04500 [Planctomycetota bacterium]